MSELSIPITKGGSNANTLTVTDEKELAKKPGRVRRMLGKAARFLNLDRERQAKKEAYDRSKRRLGLTAGAALGLTATILLPSTVGNNIAEVQAKPTHSYAMGGNKVPVGPVKEFNDKGYMPGNNDEAVRWSADMAVEDPSRSPQPSIQEGSNILVREYRENRANGENTHIASHSFANYASQDAAWRIYHENGNKWPEDLTIDMLSGDQSPEGVTTGPVGSVAAKLLGLPEHKDRDFPPGAKVRAIYRADDPYASGGNESFTTLVYEFAGVQNNGQPHAAPGMGDTKNYTWHTYTDKNGVRHYVADPKREWAIPAMKNAGAALNDEESANRALRGLFPRNNKPGTPAPKVNMRPVLIDAAKAVDADANTNLAPGAASLPREVTDALSGLWNGTNDFALGTAKLLDGQPPVDLPAAPAPAPVSKPEAQPAPVIPNAPAEVNKVVADVQKAVENFIPQAPAPALAPAPAPKPAAAPAPAPAPVIPKIEVPHNAPQPAKDAAKLFNSFIPRR